MNEIRESMLFFWFPWTVGVCFFVAVFSAVIFFVLVKIATAVSVARFFWLVNRAQGKARYDWFLIACQHVGPIWKREFWSELFYPYGWRLSCGSYWRGIGDYQIIIRRGSAKK